MTVDKNGDGLLGRHKGGVYVLGRKKRKDSSYIVMDVVITLFCVMLVILTILTLLAMSNQSLGVKAMQMMIAGRQ